MTPITIIPKPDELFVPPGFPAHDPSHQVQIQVDGNQWQILLDFIGEFWPTLGRLIVGWWPRISAIAAFLVLIWTIIGQLTPPIVPGAAPKSPVIERKVEDVKALPAPNVREAK